MKNNTINKSFWKQIYLEFGNHFFFFLFFFYTFDFLTFNQSFMKEDTEEYQREQKVLDEMQLWEKVWVSQSHYPLPVNKALILQTVTALGLQCFSIVAYDQSILKQVLIQRLNYPPVQSQVTAPQAFGKIITSSSQFITSDVCVHLAPVIYIFYYYFILFYFLLSFALSPKLVIFTLVSYSTGGCHLFFKVPFGGC